MSANENYDDADPAQQPVAPWACFGGQGTEPKEQNTQQSPLFGRSRVPQPVQS
jgi:hypothetical protein